MAHRTIIRRITHVWSYELDTWEQEYKERLYIDDSTNRIIRIERLSVGEEIYV